MLAQDGSKDVLDQPLDQGLFLDDRNGVRFLDPGHRTVDAVAFSPGAEEDGLSALDEKRAVQRG